MICVSLGNIKVRDCLKLLPRLEMAEIRLDLMEISLKDIGYLFSSHPCLIATCRQGKYPQEERRRFLLEAVEAGAAYVDLDLESDESLRPEIRLKTQASGCRLLLSFHDFHKTPAAFELHNIIDRAFKLGADLAKIACFSQTPRDNARLLGLLADYRPIVVCGLGPLGRATRVAAPLCGSPFTYASWENTTPTAPGQMNHHYLRLLLRMIKHV